MKMKWKFFVASGLLYLLGMGISFWLGAQWQHRKGDVYAVLFLISIFVGIALCYIIGLLFTDRLRKLMIFAKESVFSPSPGSIPMTGQDEIALIAESIEFLRTELTRGEEVRTRLVADVAHELRTPLAIIRAKLEAHLEQDQPVGQEVLLSVLDETIRMSKLVKDLSDLNAAEAGKLVLSRKWVEFDGLINEVIDNLSISAEEKEITLVKEGTANCEVYCDPLRIRQVLVNLVNNAIRYCRAGDVVTIHTRSFSDRVEVQVKDTGPGIAPEKLPYLFKRFYRGEDSRSRKTGGSGLGLAIAKEFVEAHEGSIHAVSELGEGSRFTIVLPRFPVSR